MTVWRNGLYDEVLVMLKGYVPAVSTPPLHKQFVSIVICFRMIAITQLFEESVEFFIVRRRYLQTNQHAPKLSPLHPVMEKGDIPAFYHRLKKTTQCPRAFRKQKTVKHFPLSFRRPPSHHIPNMRFGQVISGQVEILET